MATASTRRGRPTAVYFPKTVKSDPIVGLFKLGDGRWRASGQEKFTFREDDEAVAIARFLEWKSCRKPATDIIKIPVAVARANDPSGVRLAHQFVHPITPRDPNDERTPADKQIDDYFGLQTVASPNEAVYLKLTEDGTMLEWHRSPTQAAAFWATMRRLILELPKLCAQRTGIEELAYLRKLQPHAPVPSFDELKTIWKEHFKSSPEQKRKCLKAFEDFRTATGIATIEEIIPELVVTYRDTVHGRNLSGKTQSNHFTRIRRYFAFFKHRAVAVDVITRVLSYLSLLSPSETTVSLDPKPIEAADWKKLLTHAVGDDRAMILLMLNAGMYLAEVIRVKWEDIREDGCLVAHRRKTGQCVRVAVLWKETRDALVQVKRRETPHIFHNYAGSPLAIKGAELRFRELRDKAGVQHVTSSMLRDGAYTACVAANVTDKLCKLLVGHRTGLQDNYVKRRPSMVAPACEAIRKAYGIAK